MKEYKKYITNLARNSIDKEFMNSGPDHASIVFSNLFSFSNEEVLLYAGDLNGEVSSDFDYILSLMSYLSRGGKLKILLEYYDENKPPHLFKYLKGFKDTNDIEVKKAKYKVINESTQSKCHFVTGDYDMYRLESDTEKYIANGNFNDEETTSTLRDIFYQVFNKSASIDIS